MSEILERSPIVQQLFELACASSRAEVENVGEVVDSATQLQLPLIDALLDAGLVQEEEFFHGLSSLVRMKLVGGGLDRGDVSVL